MTNLIERSFEEERRRTRAIPGFMTEKIGFKACLFGANKGSMQTEQGAFHPK